MTGVGCHFIIVKTQRIKVQFTTYLKSLLQHKRDFLTVHK
jgi:hypothetical protein